MVVAAEYDGKACARTMEAMETRSDESLSISVIVPMRNAESTIANCLKSLIASTSMQLDIIVVDDASSDRSSDIARSFPVRLIELPDRCGAAAARNRGALSSSGELLFFLDADVLVGMSSLDKLVQCLRENPDLSAAFGSYDATTPCDNFLSNYKNLVHHYTHQHSRTDAITFCSGFGIIRRGVFNRVGGFDESCHHLEDIDLGYRLHLSGHRIRLCRDALFIHCKRYGLLGLIGSDLFGRAIPWTRLMLQHRIVRNDLNTTYGAAASVTLAFSALAAVAIAPTWVGAIVGVALHLVAIAALNHRLYSVARERYGIWFATRTSVMSVVSFVYSGVGLLLGVTAHALALPRARPAVDVMAGSASTTSASSPPYPRP